MSICCVTVLLLDFNDESPMKYKIGIEYLPTLFLYFTSNDSGEV